MNPGDPRPASIVLQRLHDEAPTDHFTLGWLMGSLHKRSFGVIMLLLGLTASVGSSGAIALAATSYPTAMRSAGTGWAMALGRLGQVCSPLVIGVMLAFRWTPAQILAAMALAPVLGGVCVLLKGKFAGGAPVLVSAVMASDVK